MRQRHKCNISSLYPGNVIRGLTGLFGLMFIVGLLGLAGWIQNIYKLTQVDCKSPYKAEICRVIGIIPPVGAVIGWIDIEDGENE